MTAAPQGCQPDIVKRLRDRDAVVLCGLLHAVPTMLEAADRIEELEAECNRWAGQFNTAHATLQARVEDLTKTLENLRRDIGQRLPDRLNAKQHLVEQIERALAVPLERSGGAT